MAEAPSPRPAEVLGVGTLREGWGRSLMARLPLRDGQQVGREVEDHGHAVAVLPYAPRRRVALPARRMRTPALVSAGLPDMLEAAAGRLDTADPAACAARKALKAASWTMPALSTEVAHLSLAAFGEGDVEGAGGGLTRVPKAPRWRPWRWTASPR